MYSSFLAEISVSSPRNYLFLLSKKIFSGSKYLKKNYLILSSYSFPAKQVALLLLHMYTLVCCLKIYSTLDLDQCFPVMWCRPFQQLNFSSDLVPVDPDNSEAVRGFIKHWSRPGAVIWFSKSSWIFCWVLWSYKFHVKNKNEQFLGRLDQ